jgi:hypothetical protein
MAYSLTATADTGPSQRPAERAFTAHGVGVMRVTFIALMRD